MIEQRFDSTGTKVGGETQVNTSASDAKFDFQITALVEGGYVVSWQNESFQDSSQYKILFQMFDASGNKVGGETQVNASGVTGAEFPSVAALSNGGFVVVYDGYDPTHQYLIYVNQFGASGNADGGETFNNIGAIDYNVTAIKGGSFVVDASRFSSVDYLYKLNLKIFTPNENIVTGDELANTITGTPGADLMYGLGGDDTYIVNNAGDLVYENNDEGKDTVKASISWVLGVNLENLVLTGSGNTNAAGNELDNTITGNSGNNTLTGDAGNDRLDGGAGINQLYGGTGNDTYVVATSHDHVFESAGQGTDTVESAITYGLADALENLTLTGAGNINGTGTATNNVLLGNAGKNTLNGLGGNDWLDGAAGINQLYGGDGDDTYVVASTHDHVYENASEGTDTVMSAVTYTLGNDVENLVLTGTANLNGTGNGLNNTLTGNAGNNTLSGGAGNDRLDGGAGINQLKGGDGDDTYVVASTHDHVYENASEGTDTVMSAITYVLGDNVENLTLTGTASLNGTGNGLNNTLTGNSGNNTLTGGAGNDRLDGGAGINQLYGGGGDDTFVVATTHDHVYENASEGTDTVLSAITYVLGDNVENLTLNGSVAVTATGNGLDNIIVGNDRANIVTGGAGNDTLYGAGGADTFVFDQGSGADVIKDFSASQSDSIDLSAYTHGTADLTLLHQSGVHTVIDLGGGNTITVQNITTASLQSHIHW